MLPGLSCATQCSHRRAAPVETCKTKSPSAPASTKVDFATQIKPIFEARCQPCHFNGGTMYQRLPFDRPETIKTLGSKLFSRIKDDNQRSLIRASSRKSSAETGRLRFTFHFSFDSGEFNLEVQHRSSWNSRLITISGSACDSRRQHKAWGVSPRVRLQEFASP